MAREKRDIRTASPSDVQVQLVDGATPTQKAAVDVDGNVATYDKRPITDPLPVVVLDDIAGGDPQAEHHATASLAAGAAETFEAALIPDTETGRLRSILVGSERPWRALVRKTDGVTPETIAVLYGEAGESKEWEPHNRAADLFAQVGDGVDARFEVELLNNGIAAVGEAGVIHCTLEWDEEAA